MSYRGLKQFQEFLDDPFKNGNNAGKTIDMEFVLSLSKPTQNIIRYMIQRKAYLEDKFVLDLESFNEFAGYTARASYYSGIIDLLKKEILAKTKLPFLYWVNREFFNTEKLKNLLQE